MYSIINKRLKVHKILFSVSDLGPCENVEVLRTEVNDQSDLHLSNVFHSTALEGSSTLNDPSYRPADSQLESSAINEETSPLPVVLNQQFNKVNTGFSKDVISLPERSMEKHKRIRHYCILCNDDGQENKAKLSKDRRQANISRHWQEVHLRHPRVRAINAAVSKAEKNRLIKQLRSEGDQYFNNILAEKEGTFILTRRLNYTKQHEITEYGDCAGCGQKLLLKFIYQHNKRCFGKIEQGRNRILIQCSRATSLFIQPSAIEPLRTRIVPKLRYPDPVTEVICEDELIVDYGNLQTLKYRESTHIDKMIRARLRRLGQFLIEVSVILKSVWKFVTVKKFIY